MSAATAAQPLHERAMEVLRSRLFEMELRKQQEEVGSARRIQVGSGETLLDDAARLAARAGAADVAVTLQIWPHMIHAWPLWNAHLEDGRRALANAGAFIRTALER